MRAGRGGFTLVEVLVVALILALSASLLLSMWGLGRRREARVDFQTRSLQAASLARAWLTEDFVQVLPAPGAAADEAHGHAVSFDRIADTPGSTPPLAEDFTARRQSVTYRFDPASRLLLRNGEAIGAGRFADVRFGFESTPQQGYTLHVTMEVWPDDELDGRREPTQRAVFRFSFHSPQGTLAVTHRDWVADRAL